MEEEDPLAGVVDRCCLAALEGREDEARHSFKRHVLPLLHTAWTGSSHNTQCWTEGEEGERLVCSGQLRVGLWLDDDSSVLFFQGEVAVLHQPLQCVVARRGEYTFAWEGEAGRLLPVVVRFAEEELVDLDFVGVESDLEKFYPAFFS